MVFSRTICQAILIAGAVTLARLLSPKDFGLVAMVTVISGIVAEMGSLRLSDATVQRPHIEQSQLSALFWINLVLGLTITCLFILTAPLVSRFYHEPRLRMIVIAMSSTFMLSGLSTQQLALMQRKMEFRKIAMLDISATVFSVIVATSSAFFGLGYWALILRRVAYQSCSTVGAWSISRWRPGIPVFDADVRSMLIFGLRSLGSYTLTYFSRNIDNLLVGKWVGASELGFYDRAYQIFVMPVYQLISPLSSVAVSTLSRISEDKERYSRYFLRALRLVAFASVAMSACVTVAGTDIVTLALGRKWSSAGPILQAFGPGIVMMLLNSKSEWLHISIGRPDRLLRWTAFRFVVGTVFLLLGLPFGARGVAIGTVVALYCLTVPGLLYAAQPISLKLSGSLLEVGRYFAAGSISGVIAWAVFYSAFGIHFNPTRISLLTRIVLSCTTILGLYSLFTFLFLGNLRVHREFKIILCDLLNSIARKANS